MQNTERKHYKSHIESPRTLLHQRNEPIQYKEGTQAQIGSPEMIAKEIEERKASESTVDPSQTATEQGQHLYLSPSPQTYGASAIALSL